MLGTVKCSDAAVSVSQGIPLWVSLARGVEKLVKSWLLWSPTGSVRSDKVVLMGDATNQDVPVMWELGIRALSSREVGGFGLYVWYDGCLPHARSGCLPALCLHSW